jgi:hypothetical protein
MLINTKLGSPRLAIGAVIFARATPDAETGEAR